LPLPYLINVPVIEPDFTSCPSLVKLQPMYSAASERVNLFNESGNIITCLSVLCRLLQFFTFCGTISAKELMILIYFDRKNLKILKYIKRCGCKGVTWSKLQKRFGEDLANAFFLTALTKQSYIVTKDENGKWLSDKYDFSVIHLGFRSYSSPKGNELI
jgi:hypothetical protein